jgi:heat shock protein HslJ
MTAFESRPWVLTAGIPFPQDVAIVRPSATFEAGTVGGSTGCNRYSGPYTVHGDSLALGRIAATMMACPPPVDAIERAYLSALGKVAGWRSEGEALVLVDADGADLLRYAAATPLGSWQLTGLQRGEASTSPLPGTELTARFGADGTLTGSSGCNAYRAAYSIDGGAIEIGAPAGTRKFCAEPAGVMEQEAAYLALLPEATRFGVDGNVLELVGPDGTRLVTYARAAT